jgi:hypothetical protein
MPKMLAAKEEPLSRIFSRDYVFKIPGYQRPYAWTTEQARDLFEDLTGFMNANPVPVNDMPPYFLGSIVLIKGEASPNAEVVDGQQRLTTLTLLLSAIRATMDPVRAGNLTSLIYEKGNDVLGTQDHYRLSLRDRDRIFFQQYVQHEGGFQQLIKMNDVLLDSQNNLRVNGRYFADSLRTLSSDETFHLAQLIATRCFLVVVATPDLDSAYRIFSVLNSRGLDLAATDILKAEIIGEVTDTQREIYTAKWEDIEEELGRDSFSDLFSHIRMVYRKAKPQGTLLKEFHDHVREISKPATFIDEVLVPMAAAYGQITDAAYTSTEGAELVNEHLRWLNRLEFADWVPPALAFMTRLGNDPTRMQSFFADLERLAYSMLVRKAGINDRIERFAMLTRSIEGGDNLCADGSPLQLSPTEKFATYQALDGPIYLTLAARARTTLLVRLDKLISGGGASYDYPTITVEHVLPQNPAAESQWLQWFPDPGVRTNWTHRLGNLALLTRKKNSAASNYDFSTKKTAYFARGGVSPFVLTTQVLGKTEWTPAIVKDRHDELLARLESEWRLADRKDPIQELLAQLD